MTRCTPPQLSLFDADLHAEVQRLTQRLDDLGHEHQVQEQALRETQQALRNAWAQIQDLTRALHHARTHADGWRFVADLGRGAPGPLPDVDRLLMELTKLCHPDRWEHQPATTLAHEAMVFVNAVKQQREGRR